MWIVWEKKHSFIQQVTEEQFALAGIDISKPVESITQEQFQRILDVVGQQPPPQQQTTTFG